MTLAARRAEAIGQVVLSKREQLVLVRPLEKLLSMTVLRYASQVRLPETFAAELPAGEIDQQELELAGRLIESRTPGEFDLGQYKDAYAEKLLQLVEAKVQGKQLVAPPVEEPRMVVNLMEALRASVAQSGSAGQGKAVRTALSGQLSRKVKTARKKRAAKRSAGGKGRKKTA